MSELGRSENPYFKTLEGAKNVHNERTIKEKIAIILGIAVLLGGAAAVGVVSWITAKGVEEAPVLEHQQATFAAEFPNFVKQETPAPSP